MQSEFETADSSSLVSLAEKHGLYNDIYRMSESDLEHYLGSMLSLSHAQADYLARSLDVPVHLFRAVSEPTDNPMRGWDAIVPRAALLVQDVPGDHGSMVREPYVGILADTLWECMLAAEKDNNRLLSRAGSCLVALNLPSLRPTMSYLLVPGAGATPAMFADLAGRLPSQAAVFGLQPAGMDALSDIPDSDIDFAARRYAAEVVERIPCGDIHLVGHSFGGWVATELARLLEEQGYFVRTLTLIDSSAPGGKAIPDLTDVEILMSLVGIYEDLASADMCVRRDAIAVMSHTDRIKLVQQKLVEHNLLDHRVDISLIDNVFKVFAACLRTPYLPTPGREGTVKLIVLHDERLDERGNDERKRALVQGWSRVFPELTYVDGDATHSRALREPFVGRLASLILE
ncbi:thioesterase domain-containing protein [Luteibacter sp. Sphag1AF]|nr:thioesterase domain-containing protein [Luteibacter sp. Sphag1AF]